MNYSGHSALFLALAAPFVGSFIATAVLRMGGEESALHGRSRCDSCRVPLSWRDLVPVASWLALGGRCRHCGTPLARLYPATEIAFVAIAAHGLVFVPAPLAAISIALGWTLLTLALVDLRTFLLPDALTLPLAAGGLALVAWREPAAFTDHAVGLAAGAGLLLGVRALYFRMRGREGLGLGDVKLTAAAGAWLGWTALPSVLLVATATGLAAVVLTGLAGRPLRADDALPFGPFLCLGFALAWHAQGMAASP